MMPKFMSTNAVVQDKEVKCNDSVAKQIFNTEANVVIICT